MTSDMTVFFGFLPALWLATSGQVFWASARADGLTRFTATDSRAAMVADGDTYSGEKSEVLDDENPEAGRLGGPEEDIPGGLGMLRILAQSALLYISLVMIGPKGDLDGSGKDGHDDFEVPGGDTGFGLEPGDDTVSLIGCTPKGRLRRSGTRSSLPGLYLMSEVHCDISLMAFNAFGSWI